MKRVEFTQTTKQLLKSAAALADELGVEAVLFLVDLPHPFKELSKIFLEKRLVIAAAKTDVIAAAKEDEINVIQLQQEPETRQMQLGQALLEGIADKFFHSGKRILTVYTLFDREHLDTFSIISLNEQLSRLSARDLQRLETKVPLPTLRQVVDLAVEIGREGREGKKVGTLFVVGDHRKALKMSHEGVYDPFKGYLKKERLLKLSRVKESIKEIAQMDGAFIISSDGIVEAAGRILDASAEGLSLSKGLGSRHWAAAAISKCTQSVAIAVSESTGTVRLFHNGNVVLRIEPMERAMVWQELQTEPPLTGDPSKM